MTVHRPTLRLAVAVVLWLPVIAQANVWVFEPSAAIDQRFDDNYTIDPDSPDGVSATRVVGTLGLSREAQSAKFTGLVRVDGLVTQSDTNNSSLSSNQVLFLKSEFTQERSKFEIGFNIKRDTPSRDISADLTDISSVASDTGASVTQDNNVARTRLLLSPNWQYNLTRRTTLETSLDFTQVAHETPSANDTLLNRWYESAQPGDVPPNPITIEDTGFFTVRDELDDFKEIALNFGVKNQLSPITTLSFFAGFSRYSAMTEPNPIARIPFEQTIPDDEVPDIRRNPKRLSLSTTSTFRIGYDRAFTETLNVGFQVGIYSNKIDDTDLLRANDPHDFQFDPNLSDAQADAKFQEALNNRISSNSGYLANVTATKSTGLTQYSAKFGVDVLPSDVGSQVESLEVIGDLFRVVNPLLDFSFRVRAYEPDAFNAAGDNKFARRFLSMEPKLIWRFTRAWTTAASVRYRRQKSQSATRSGDSTALLFSLKYTPPSAIRDAQAAN